MLITQVSDKSMQKGVWLLLTDLHLVFGQGRVQLGSTLHAAI